MTPRKRHGKEQPATDILESGVLPPELEDAQAEYFADMAFDDRLLTILELEPKTIQIDTIGNSVDLLGEGFFTPNSLVYETIKLEEDGPIHEIPLDAFSFRATGNIVEQPGELIVDLKLSSDIDDQPAMYIQSDPKNRDGFYVYRDGLIDEPSYISTIELTQLTMMVCGLDGTARQQLRRGMGDKPNGYRPVITQLWKNLGERSGSVTESSLLIEALADSTTEKPQQGKLSYISRETPTESVTTMILQHVTDFPDLDSQEIYTLRLVYASSGHTSLEKEAQKTISSGITPHTLRGVEMTHTTHGTTHKLDVHDPVIQQLFVNTFDEIVAA
jgi:hypothetical protein